jgi:hypothetical protein
MGNRHLRRVCSEHAEIPAKRQPRRPKIKGSPSQLTACMAVECRHMYLGSSRYRPLALPLVRTLYSPTWTS